MDNLGAFERVLVYSKENKDSAPHLGWALIKRPANVRKTVWQILVYLDQGDCGWFHYDQVVSLMRDGIETANMNKHISPERRLFNFLQMKALNEVRREGKDWSGLSNVNIGQALFLGEEKTEENLLRVEEVFDCGVRVRSTRKDFDNVVVPFFSISLSCNRKAFEELLEEPNFFSKLTELQAPISVVKDRRPQIEDWELAMSFHPALLEDFDACMNLRSLQKYTISDGSMKQSSVTIEDVDMKREREPENDFKIDVKRSKMLEYNDTLKSVENIQNEF